MRIAIVEDEIRIREGLRHLLSKAAPRDEVVGEASDGRAGMQLLLERRPDLVLADIRMPEMDGIEMLRAVQEKGFSPVVIFLSAYSDFSYAREAMKLGVSEYLLKPVAVDELVGAIDNARKLVEHRMLSRLGQRTLADILAEALLGSAPLSDDVLTYVERQLHWRTDTALGVLLLYGDGQGERWHQQMRSARLGACETLPYGEYLVTVFAEYGGAEHLAFELENDALPRLRAPGTEAPLAMLAFADGFAQLHEVFTAMQSHFEFSLIAPAGKLMRYPELLKWPLTMLTYPIELETACRLALGRRDGEALLKQVRGFGARLMGDQLHHPRDIKEAYVRFAMTLLSTGRELGRAMNEGHELMSRLMTAHRPEELDAHLMRLAESLCEEEEKTVAAESLLVRRATSLMKEYYAQGITLEEIAQKLSVTPEHLGTKIHREMGCTFGTLMKRLRVEYAKKLLLTTDMRLYEIALAVGYTDAKYFSHVFKQTVGMLPLDFRTMNR